MVAVHRTILVVDVAGFGDPRRTNLHQIAVRQSLYRMLAAACERSGIPWAKCDHEDRGDGVLVMIPATVPKVALVEALPDELVAALREHNTARPVEERIRLRMAVHAGEIHYDEHGVVGRSVNLTFRLLEAPALKAALAGSRGFLAVITSAWFFDEVVWHSRTADRDRYVRATVSVKETTTTAWICLPDADPPPMPLTTHVEGHVERHVESPLPVPHQLPTDIRQFVGRESELAELTGLLDTGAGRGTVVISAIDGTAGIGKTTLALHWAHRVKDRFPGGQLHVNLRGFDPRAPLDPGQALHGFLRALGVDANAIPADLDARSALYRSLLADRRMLIVLDNARSSDHVRPLLPAGSGCLVVITSRSRLDGLAVREGADHVALDVLSEVDAAALLAERIGVRRLAAEPEAATDLAALCARLPLALSIVAARAAGQPGFPVAELVRQLRDERGRLDVLDLGDTDLSLRAVFSWSTRVLSPPAARLFQLLGVHPGPEIDRYAAGSLAGSVSRARELFAELSRAHLITEYTPGRFRLHDLLRAYAAEQADRDIPAGERTEAAHAFLAYYLRVADIADRTIQPCRDGVVRVPEVAVSPDLPDVTSYAGAMGWFAAETGTLLALIAFAADHGFADYTCELAYACTTFLRRSGRRYERVAVHRTALAAARRSGDLGRQATALRLLAPALGRLDHYEEALGYLDEAGQLCDALGDEVGAIAVHFSYTRVFEALTDHAKALEHARRAWELIRADHDNPLRQGDALRAMGRQLSLLSKHDEALALCERALTLYSAIGHPEGEADVLINIGEIEQRLGRHEDAVSRYQRSLDIDRLLGDRYWEAESLDRLGDAYLAIGDAGGAERAWRQSAEIFTELRHPNADPVGRKLSALLG